ncbi:unnamed protein product [Phaedon cochleariae]|uniref:Uncharacterized protein n=1 Tax=Phaedon cochleariae TaxID=80249 RepID=A0A9N9X1A3_PHACE|nr:unnamed protein product [Phaedon cochleariae]
MVLQNVLSYILNKYLGEFVENLDANQLNVGIWGGDVELKNLVLKPSALNELDLPVQAVYGTIGKLVLKIPWKNVYTSPSIISVEDIYLIVQPNLQVKYDPEKEEKNQYESKKQEIQRIEEAKKAVAEKGKPPTKLGWTEELTNKLIATIIKNIQLNIKNIHIRYEDRVTNSKFPFAFGVTLSELVVESTDANWEKTIADDIVKIYKVLQLDGLSVYFNSRSRMYAELPTIDFINKMRKEIASKKSKPGDYTYILGPINSSARLKINQQPENDSPPYSLPKVHLNLQMEKLFIGISKTQYRDLIALADSMNRMTRGARYRKYRPNVTSYKGHYKEWWHFAYRCLVEGDIRRKKRDWDWNHILGYRNMCREYQDLSMKQLQNKNLSSEEKERIVECEKVLDLTNIVIIRHTVEVESERLTQVVPEKKGWFGWFKSSSQVNEDKASDKILKQFKEEMTPEEKSRLYKAIGYQENAIPTIFPEEYVEITGTFLLRSLELELMDDDDKDGTQSVLLTDLKNVKCKVETRPAASAIKVYMKLDSLTTIGMQEGDFIPQMIAAESETQKDLLEIRFESNPIDKKCDYRIHVVTQPIRVVYDEKTINKIVDVFTIPPDTALEEISDVAANKISDVKEMTSLGLQYAIEKHVAIDLNVDLRAPYVIIPYAGRFDGCENVLVVNLGHLRVYTDGKRSSTAEVRRLYEQGRDRKDIFEMMMKSSYDNFKLELTDLQMVVAQGDEDWYKAVKDSDVSDMHVLNPLSMSITVSKCLIVEDPRLPLNRVRGELPHIDLIVSEARLMLLLSLIASIQLPGSAVPEPQPLSRAKGSSMMLLKYKEMQESAKATKQLIKDSPESDSKGTVQFTTLEAEFILSECSLTINQQESIDSKVTELAVFKVNSLKCELKQQTYVTNVSLLLGSVSLKLDRLGEKIDVINTPLSGNKEDQLFEVKFSQVDEKCPELHSTYKSCECSLLLNFRVLSVVLHQEGLLSLLKLSTAIQDQLSQVSQDRDRVATTRQTSYLSVSDSRDDAPEKILKKKKKIPVVVSTIKFKLIAALKELNVKFATDATDISFCAIRGIDTTIIVKDSYTQVNARLQEIAVIDLNEQTIHKLILSNTEGVAITSQVVMNNNTDVTDKPDIQVNVNLGEMRIVFLNWFVTNMLNFLNQFQDAQQKIIEASQAAAQSAKENMKDVYAKATKISLDIRLKAPIVVVPVDSQRYDCLILDMGVITLSNTFLTLDVKNEEGFPAIVDDLKVDLTDLKISRVQLNEKSEVQSESSLLEPLTFTLIVKRNLSSSWYISIPDIDVFGKIGIIKLLLSKADYQMIMDILSGNLAEGKQDATTVDVQSNTQMLAQASTTVVDTHTGAEMTKEMWKNKQKTHIFLKFAFSMDHFIIDMFIGGATKLDDQSPNHDPKKQLARFSLEGLSLKGRIMTDQSIVTSVLLLNCVLDDMRKGRGGKLRRLVGRSQSSGDLDSVDGAAGSKESAAFRSMIDVTYQQTDNDTFIDCRVFSFTVILSVDYLMKVADFFNASDSQRQQSNVAPTKSAASVSRTVAKTQLPVVNESEKVNQMTINLKVEKPDIILVEHMDNIDTNAMIMNAEILIKLRTAGVHQVLNGVIKDLQLYTCVYNPALRAETRGDVLHPVTISVAGSTPLDKGLHIELLVTAIHVRVSPATIELLNRVLVTMTSSGITEDENTEVVFNYTDLWQQKPLEDKDYWFLRPEYGFDALAEQFLAPSGSMLDAAKIKLQELCIISMPSIIITVEIGVGIKTLPVLMLESAFKGSARNWSSQLCVQASLTLQMGYYNSHLALWEPLIEPEVVRNNNFYVPWELKLEVSMNQNDDESQSTLSPGSESEVELPQPLMSIDVISEKNLELTITKTFLEDLTNLQKAFASAIDAKAVKPTTHVDAPYKVLNEIGEDVTLLLEQSSFEMVEGGTPEDINKATAIALQLKPEFTSDKVVYLGKELATSSTKKDIYLQIRVDDKRCELTLPVMRADKRFFSLHYRSATLDNWGIVCDIKVDDGVTVITLRSILQVHNHFTVPVDVYFMTTKGDELEFIGSINPKSLLNVPLKAVYNPTNELFFAISDYSVSNTPFIWKDLQTNLSVTKKMHCSSKTSGKPAESFVIKAVGEMEQVYYENTSRHTMSSNCYNIHLRPAVNFKNCLPVDIVCCVDESAEELTVKAGDTLQLAKVDPGRNVLVIRIAEYLDREWSCRKEIVSDPDEFSVWTFHSYDSPTKMSLDLGMHILNKYGSLLMTLYCPFWMLNKTDMMLVYRTSDENMNVLHHPANFKGPILFSFNAKNFFGKKKASIKIASGEWSDKFSLDVAGSSGVITCKYEETTYQIGVHNQLTSNGLTKQVTFTPYYVIINNAPFAIECQENDRPADPWVAVEPRSCSPLWPKSEKSDKLMRMRVKGTPDCTPPFLYTESHTTLLKLANKFGGINVDIQLTEGGVYINLAAYEVGSAPALLINHSTMDITFWEKDSVQKRVLPPKHVCFYTWENPSGSRILVWDRGNRKEIMNDLRKDTCGEFKLSDRHNVCWASFLDGMQRVLLFTEEKSLAEGAQASNLFEVIQQEITVAVHGVGVSLVNNARRQEIMYIGIASTGVIWESKKPNSKRFKHLGPKDSLTMENAFQDYLRRSESDSNLTMDRVIIDAKTEVDFKAGLMLKPHKRTIRRTFLTGLWMQLKTSPSQMQLHAKINRLQIDNQMYDCIFPVVLAPVPPPKSVSADSGVKPFVEVSIVKLLLKNSQIQQFKYFKVLVQEFHIKVDIGFINAIMDMLEHSEDSVESEKELFLAEMKIIDEELYSHVSSQSIQEQKSFYDLLHFSPFKIHISFSLAAGSTSGQNPSTPNFLNVLLQGLGVTLTDMQDVVFKLAFFQREHTFLTQRQLISEATSHYVGQAVKQLYVLVLGLDVLGNPYGLVVGITKGVEDLFYEPFQGAIQGPGEFAEGLALGVRSLFGHTVGGAAGAMSRITGAMGKGIAALTFDDDYQRKRREQLNKRPATAQEGFARSGRGLVMGVYSGVTGVFTKPVEGAKEQGVEGFFKGLGKGAVGLVTRPVAGVVDFASGSLDVVKRAAECNEDTSRLRLPRFLQADRLVRPYNKLEAEGLKLLMELSKGKYATTDVYVAHYAVVAKKEILLLTDKRVAYVCHNDIFGGWQMEWSYTWEEIQAPPKVVPKGISFTTSEKRKLFGSSEYSKTILIDDPSIKEEICVKIESLRNS